MYMPSLMAGTQSQLITTTFLGYDHNPVINDGAFYDMKNLTGDLTPLMAVRNKRGKVATLSNGLGLYAKEQLAWIDGNDLYFAGKKVEGVTISTEADMLPKQMVSMGAYLVIWPDKVYMNTVNLTDCGKIDATAETVTVGTVSMCRGDGTDYDMNKITISDTAPEDPANNAMWIDTSDTTHILMQYSTTSGEWSQVATTYVKIEAEGIGEQFSQYDGVTISGVEATGEISENVQAELDTLNNTVLIYERGTDYIVVAGLIEQVVEVKAGIKVARSAPDLDFITESNNRLWGCKYGMVDGSVVNEIYASKLGDLKNWNCFMGLSTDSYTVSVGSDGRFTGCATVAGSPVFFKEDCLHKISGSLPSSFSVTTSQCRGVQEGCGLSLQTVNETLFYMSRAGVMTYDGSLPSSVNSCLGGVRYYNAVAGATGEKYYISMEDSAGAWSLFCFNTKTGMWHKEDSTHAVAFGKKGDELYFLTAGGEIMAVNGTEGEAEEDVAWEAVTGMYGYDAAGQKYLSRFNIRMQMEKGATCQLLLEYDSNGEWVDKGTVTGTSTRTFMIPVIPRRCDHVRIKLQGVGMVKVYSIARLYEEGGDG